MVGKMFLILIIVVIIWKPERTGSSQTGPTVPQIRVILRSKSFLNDFENCCIVVH